jgi:peptidoglycan/LPS O-acetylase OafA/YrhL
VLIVAVPLVLLSLYLLVAYANSRLPRSGELSYWTVVFIAVVFACTAFGPVVTVGTVSDDRPVIFTAILVCLAFAGGALLTRRQNRD